MSQAKKADMPGRGGCA